MMYRSLHILSALEHAGLARMEYIKPLHPKRRLPRGSHPPSADELNGGIRYVLSREATEALGLANNYGGGCIPAGRITPDLLDVQRNRSMVQIKARGIVEQTPDWVIKISEQLPALKSMIENGVQMMGQMTFANNEGEGKWRLAGLLPNYPDMYYNSLPTHLVPMLPHTAAASPARLIKAPALVPQSATNLDQGLATPSPVMPTPTALAVAAPRNGDFPGMPQMVPAMPPAQPSPPYPAEGAPVHVVSIYQAGTRGFQEHPEGKVNLKVQEDNAVLLLFAYEPIEWHIEAGRGIDLKRVIAIGYYEPRVTFSGGGKPQVVVSRSRDIRQRMGLNLRMGYHTQSEANDLVDIAATSRAITDALPKTYQARNEAPATGFTIGPQTPAFVLPAPQKPNGTPVVLKSAFTEAVQGNKVLRGSSGAYTDAWSNLSYSAGRIYFEGKMKVTGSLAAHTHANIGICLEHGNSIEGPSPGRTSVIAHGEQKLYKEGDLFGIAADLDQHKLYFRVNGKWLGASPESGNGFPLEPGKQYRACAFAAGTVTGEVEQGIPRSDTTWEINFGDMPFQTPLPSGYVAFNGSK